MSYYDAIDADFFSWIESKGHTAQTLYRDEPVRGFELWSKDHSQRVEVGVSQVTGSRVELSVFGGKRKRKKISGSLDQVRDLLDQAEHQALEWLGET